MTAFRKRARASFADATASDAAAAWQTIERVASETVYEYLEYPGVGLGVGWCESGYVFSEGGGGHTLAHCKALCDAAPNCAGFDWHTNGWECRGFSTVEPEEGDGCYPNPGYNVYVRYAPADDVTAVSLYLSGSGTARLDVYDADDVDAAAGAASADPAVRFAGLTSVAASAATAFNSAAFSEVRFADFSPPLSFSDAQTKFYVWLRDVGGDLDASARPPARLQFLRTGIVPGRMRRACLLSRAIVRPG